MLPRYHLRYCLSWPYTQISWTSPQRRAFLWRPWGWGAGSRGAGLSVLSRGFSLSWLTCARCGVLYSSTLSERRGLTFPRPTGSLTARVLRNRGSAPPRVSIWGPTLLIRPRQSSPGTARLVSHRLVSAEPRALAATHPLGHSLVFSHVRSKACLSR